MFKLKLYIAFLLFSFSSVSTSSELYEALLAKANSGSAEASYHLGMLFNNGLGVEKSPSKAFKLFVVAAENGDPLGHYKVGCYYAGQFGNIKGLELSETKAFEHKLIAAEAGYSRAQIDVAAVYYHKGEMMQAIDWAYKAGEQGSVQSLSNLLSLYQMPNSQHKNHTKAYSVILKIKSLIPKNEELETLKKEIENKLKDSEIAQINNQIDAWSPKKSALTEKANHGINRANLVAGLATDD